MNTTTDGHFASEWTEANKVFARELAFPNALLNLVHHQSTVEPRRLKTERADQAVDLSRLEWDLARALNLLAVQAQTALQCLQRECPAHHVGPWDRTLARKAQ